VEFVEENLGQWIRQIEADEHVKVELPTERRTRERRHLQFLERDGRFQEMVAEVRRLPNGPESQEVFRGFWANPYIQEYQGPLAHEGAELLALKAAALLELDALEDEELRETGGRELVRPRTLIREDGLIVGCRSSTGTGWSVSAPE
jgi:hypothetical protein